jgi:hypothetical protein
MHHLEAGQQALERPPAFDVVTDDRHAFGKRRQLLAGCSHDDDRGDHLAEQADHARQHQLAGERQPGLGLAHSAGTTATENDTGDARHGFPS